MILRVLGTPYLRTWISLLLLAFGFVPRAGGSILIGSVDVGLPGLSVGKLSVSAVSTFLPKIISRYDIIALQDVADAQTAKELLNLVNQYSMNGSNRYGVAISGMDTPEQLVFYYRQSSIDVVNVWSYPDDNGTFDTPPFAVHVQPRRSDSVGVRDFLCLTVHTSSDPAQNLALLQELPRVISEAERHWRDLGTAVPDILLMGNLNADCGSFPAENWQKISLWTDRSGRYKWLLTRSADTTTSRATSCALDRFVASGNAIRRSIIASSAAVFRFDLAFALTSVEALSVSSHYPIEVRLQAADSVDQQPTQAGNPSLVVHTAPVGFTRSRSAKIWFELDPLPPTFNPKKNVLSFMCRYNDAPMATMCTSPWRVDMMEEGPHTLVIIPVTSQGQNYSAASYTWTVDTRPPLVTGIQSAVDSSNHQVLTFSCDEGECMYECAVHSAALNPTNTFTPCWGGFRSTALMAGTNMSIRAVDRAGNGGDSTVHTFLDFMDPSAGASGNGTSDFLAKNLIFVACGCTALGISMVWIVILLMCRTQSPDDENSKASEEAAVSPYQGQVQTGGANNQLQQLVEQQDNVSARSPTHLSPLQCPVAVTLDAEPAGGVGKRTLSPCVAGTPGLPKAPAAAKVGEGSELTLNNMQEHNSASSIRQGLPSPYSKTEKPKPIEERTHFNAEQTPPPGRESGDGQSIQDEKVCAFETNLHSRVSLVSASAQFGNKARVNCPSRSHRSSRCVCDDREELIQQHNERKRERRRRRQYSRQHQSTNGGHGALTDVEHYTYTPSSKRNGGSTPYFPLRSEKKDTESNGSVKHRPRELSAQAAAAALNSSTIGVLKPKILDAQQRRRLAKRMAQERRAWTHFFSEINPSDGESVCSSMRSAPVLPSGMRLLTTNIDEKPEIRSSGGKSDSEQSILSGVMTCV